MAKNLKLTIKNTQIAEAINLGKLKSKIAKKQIPEEKEEKSVKKSGPTKTPKAEIPEQAKGVVAPSPSVKEEAPPRIRARSKSAFSEGSPPPESKKPLTHEEHKTSEQEFFGDEGATKSKSSEELRKEIFAEELEELSEKKETEEKSSVKTAKTFSELVPEKHLPYTLKKPLSHAPR